MPKIAATVTCPAPQGFRARQVAGMFDLDLELACQESFAAEVPALEESWSIGAIVGASGSGKSTIAQKAFGAALTSPFAWPRDHAVVDAVATTAPAATGIRDITSMLTAVGFSSPPAWLRPYHALSTGEKFRCDLARAMLSDQPLIVFDEFTSVVDRTVAKVASAAINKAIRSGHIAKRLVIVSCHSDILPWLTPEWTVDMTSRTLDWGRLRRPRLRLRVVRCRQRLWRVFARHHYLTASLPRSASCFTAVLNNQPVAFCATAGLFGAKGMKRVARIVTLPDYQGIGIGSRLLQRVCQGEREAGFRVVITTSHPAMISSCQRSRHWRLTRVRKHGHKSRQACYGLTIKNSYGRAVASFEYEQDTGCRW